MQSMLGKLILCPCCDNYINNSCIATLNELSYKGEHEKIQL